MRKTKIEMAAAVLFANIRFSTFSKRIAIIVTVLIQFHFAQAVDPIPANVAKALRAGGVNLVFSFYDTDNYRPNDFDAELPLIRSSGAGHVRLAMSMDILENGTTGTLRDDRWQDLKGFIVRAQANGLVTIVDIHNTGLKIGRAHV